MSDKCLKSEVESVSQKIHKEAEGFTKSLVGKAFKPLVSLLLYYIRLNNQRWEKLEAKQNG